MTSRNSWVYNILIVTCVLITGNVMAEISVERKAQLLHLLRHDCGSCHGMTMKGGLGPPLLPGMISTKPKGFLVHTILEGRSGTAMPPWKTQLSRAEASWIVEILAKGLPSE